jgi:hypothetical protein
MKLQRLRIWGVKDGRRIFIDQQGPELVMDPEVPELRQSEDVLQSARKYLDEVIQVWQGPWDSDDSMQERAETWNRAMRERMRPPRLYTPGELRRIIQEHKTLTSCENGIVHVSGRSEEYCQELLRKSDEELAEVARSRYESELEIWGPVGLTFMREREYQDFVRAQGPPFYWHSIAGYVAKHGDGIDEWRRIVGDVDEDLGQRRQGHVSFAPPTDLLKCRDCLNPSRWIWYSCFPGPDYGSAGWVAICEQCQTWHRERTAVIR